MGVNGDVFYSDLQDTFSLQPLRRPSSAASSVRGSPGEGSP